MGFVIDSNAPYFTEFPLNCAGDAVYMTAEDELLGHVFAVVYRAHPGVPKLSVILIGSHGTSGFVDMTLDRSSRYYGACRALAPSHVNSPVRRALAIAVLRTYATMDKPLRNYLGEDGDESAAGALGSKFKLLYGKFPQAIGSRMLEAGLIAPKTVGSAVVDIVYEDSDFTIDQNNELVYLLGEQLEQLFDPLSEYSPEPTDRLYTTPESSSSSSSLDSESSTVQNICERFYLLQARARGDILDFLQSTLIPLRVEVLKGSFPNLSIARLNAVFSPTIDEQFRINNFFYEALRASLPFGAFEVVKACGATIPYFFRACMRHKAATQDFESLLNDLIAAEPGIGQFLNNSEDVARVVKENHLSQVKEVLQELVKEKKWTSFQQKLVDEYYDVACGTLDAFTKESTEQPDIFSVITDWPAALNETQTNRRVVTIFDAVDALEPSDTLRSLHLIFIVFTDSLVVCRPTEPIPTHSLNGLHLPSIGDILLHAMLNKAPINRNVPPLKVIAWSPILDVQFANYGQNLFVMSKGISGSFLLKDSQSLVSLMAKAKITTKTRPFHLFRLDGETVIYSTVQELRGYGEERNRSPIALFLSCEVNEQTLKDHQLVAAMSLNTNGDNVIINVISTLGYSSTFETTKADLQNLVVSEVSYLLTLSLSSQNPAKIELITSLNKSVAMKMIQWASRKTAHKHNANTLPQTKASTTEEVVIPSSSIDSLKPAEPPREVRRVPNLPVGPNHSEYDDIDISADDVSADEFDTYSSYMDSEDSEQRDVDDWYHRLHASRDDDESLTDISEPSNSSMVNESIQIGGFLDRSASNLYNKNAGRAFPRIESSIMEANHQRSATESSFETIATINSSSESDTTVEDFSYLASLVDSSTVKVNNTPSLRDVSLVRLGSRLLNNDSVNASEQTVLIRDSSLSKSVRSESSRTTIQTPYVQELAPPADSDPVRDGHSRQKSSGANSLASSRSGNSYSYLVNSDNLFSTTSRPTASPVRGGGTATNLDPIKEIATPKIEEDADATPTLSNPPKFQPFVDLEEADWRPAPIYSSYKNNDPFSPKFNFIYETKEGDLGDRGSYELAENWLAWNQASRASIISTESPMGSPTRSPVRLPTKSPTKSSIRSVLRSPVRSSVKESQSYASFRKMVMSSSFRTLQLASYINQVDQKAISLPVEAAFDLETVKNTLSSLYIASATPESEYEARKKLTGCHMLLLRLDCRQLADGLLEIEWMRRAKISDKTNTTLLWKH